MVPVLVAAAVAAAGGAAYYVYKHWDEIKAWFSKFLTNLKAAIKEKMRNIANAAVIVGQKIREGVAQLKHKLFYKEDGKWIQETTRVEVTEDEVPPYIRAKIAMQEADITQEMELELGQSVG